MRAKSPEPFSIAFSGAEGAYTIRFQPTDEWDGVIDTEIAGIAMQWSVVDVDRLDSGGLVLGGMTSDTEGIWHDQFRFELRLDDSPVVIRYWGNQVMWREDTAA